MTVADARAILGDRFAGESDDEIAQRLGLLERIAEWAIAEAAAAERPQPEASEVEAGESE